MSEMLVDFLPQDAHGLPGRLGITVAPGRWRPGLDPASDTLVQDDLGGLRDRFGARWLVTLLEEFEMRKLGIAELLGTARRMGFQSIWLPVPDAAAPPDLPTARRVVERMLEAMTAGDTVVVHCRGGLGRSGTIAACCLVARGRRPAEAIETVRRARPGALEVRSQEVFVERFAREHG